MWCFYDSQLCTMVKSFVSEHYCTSTIYIQNKRPRNLKYLGTAHHTAARKLHQKKTKITPNKIAQVKNLLDTKHRAYGDYIHHKISKVGNEKYHLPLLSSTMKFSNIILLIVSVFASSSAEVSSMSLLE